jgi:hypothetical protein
MGAEGHGAGARSALPAAARGGGMEAAMSDDGTANLVADGLALARRANRPRIEQEIRARHAAELAGADICDSLRIEAQIRAEIERALAVEAPTGALY